MKITIRSPTPHSASRVSAGLDQVGSLNQPGSGSPSVPEDRVDRAGAGVEQEDERERRRPPGGARNGA